MQVWFVRGVGGKGCSWLVRLDSQYDNRSNMGGGVA